MGEMTAAAPKHLRPAHDTRAAERTGRIARSLSDFIHDDVEYPATQIVGNL